MTTEPPPAADPLYDLPPSEFVGARNALAKELRAAGDKAQAAVVAKLRRPSPVAFAINQLARHDRGLLDAALAAGDALLAATDAAVAGDAGALRPATAADREATRALTDGVAAALGTPASDLAQRVTAVVRAAGSIPEVAELVRTGRLTDEPEPSGFGLGFGLGDDGDATTPSAAPRDDLAPRRQAKQAKVDQAAREQAEREATERRERQRREAEHRKRVDQLASRARRLAEKAHAAEQAATDARAEATAAQDALDRAREEGP